MADGWTLQDWFVGLTALAATIGLFLTAHQIKLTRKSADLRALQDFDREVRERESALTRAWSNEADRTRAFNDLMNFLEVHAAASNKHLFGTGSREIVRDKLTDVLAILNAEESTHTQIQAAVLSEATFTELTAFAKRHKKTIERRRVAYLQSKVPPAPMPDEAPGT